MSAELRKAKARADAAWQESVHVGYNNLRTALGSEYRIALWSNSIDEMYQAQWCSAPDRKDRGWDWPKIHRNYRGPKDRVAALLTGDRLSALTQISASRERLTVGLLEGDSRPDCPLKSKRALILLDLAATYGQVLGCNGIHLEALNHSLMVLYRDKYGFVHAPSKGAPFAMIRGLT